MHILLLLAIGVLPPDDQSAFSVQAELQGLYEEISQATLQFVTAEDIDQFHEVLYTPDWVFVDTKKQVHPWSEVRAEEIQALKAPALSWMTQSIRKLSLASNSATAVVDVTIVRTIVDDEGRYGPKHASHALTETTPFRDVWVRTAESWKVQSREQIAQPTVSVAASQYEKYLKDYDIGR